MLMYHFQKDINAEFVYGPAYEARRFLRAMIARGAYFGLVNEPEVNQNRVYGVAIRHDEYWNDGTPVVTWETANDLVRQFHA